MKNFLVAEWSLATILLLNGSAASVSSTELFLSDIDTNLQLMELFEASLDREQFPSPSSPLSLAGTYNKQTDNSWGDHGESCDLEAWSKEEDKQLEILHQAQKFTDALISKETCLVDAKELYKIVDQDGNGIVSRCEAVKEYAAFGNNWKEFVGKKADQVPIDGYDMTYLEKFCSQFKSKEQI